MADMVFVADGKSETLKVILATRYTIGTFRLYQNDFTPDEDTVLADLVEADFSNYARITPTWSLVTPDAFGRATSIADLATFTCDGLGAVNSIFGIYFVDDTASLLQFVFRFPAPISMALAGDTIPYRARLLDGNLAPP